MNQPTGGPSRGAGRSKRGAAARRYPALVWLLGAVALALLLPSGLTLPNRGPSTLAEYAPVPGQGKGTSPVANLGEAGSGDLGGAPAAGAPANTSTTTTPGPSALAPGRVIRKGGTKRCVGDPARQTEDPLSPPCVAFFDGDNGGATAKGVTADEVTVVMHGEDRTTDQIVDCSAPPASSDSGTDSLCRGFTRFFNERYQTYGRHVRVYDTHSVANADIEDKLRPFASLISGSATTQTIGITSNGQLRSDLHLEAVVLLRLPTRLRGCGRDDRHLHMHEVERIPGALRR